MGSQKQWKRERERERESEKRKANAHPMIKKIKAWCLELALQDISLVPRGEFSTNTWNRSRPRNVGNSFTYHDNFLYCT